MALKEITVIISPSKFENPHFEELPNFGTFG